MCALISPSPLYKPFLILIIVIDLIRNLLRYRKMSIIKINMQNTQKLIQDSSYINLLFIHLIRMLISYLLKSNPPIWN